jgi:hypothetical protein
MDRLIIALLLISIFVIGFLRIRKNRLNIIDKLNFLNEFRNKYIQIANMVKLSYGGLMDDPSNIDKKIYHWLILNSSRAQTEVGHFGIGEISMPARGIISNYQFITNVIPKFREASIQRTEITSVDDILLRCIGYYQNEPDELLTELKNPLKWFQNGLRYILSFPIELLYSFGMVTSNFAYNTKNNIIYKFITGFLALIGILSGIIGLITGWDQFVGIVSDFYNEL